MTRVLCAVAVCAVMFSGFTSSSMAQFNGEALLKHCQTWLDNPIDLSFTGGSNFGVCSGYIAGVRDTVKVMKIAYRDDEKKGYCLPENVQIIPLMQVVASFLENNPEALDQPAVGNVVFAFAAAFPCTEGG